MNGWMWLGGAVLLAIVEMLSLDLILLMLAGGALAGALTSALGAPLPVQILVASLTALLLLFALRPWLLRHLRERGPLTETNTAALVGKEAVVLAMTTESGGRVKLGGEVWSARAADDVGYTPGTEVRVTAIDGATAVVRAVVEPA